jgi:hypothetical protein
MYKLIDVIEFLLQSSFRNPIEFMGGGIDGADTSPTSLIVHL